MQSIKKIIHLDNIWRRIGLRLLIVCFLFSSQPGHAIDIADEPMATRIQTAPPLIMFVLDNSGSMDWSFMAAGQSQGKWNGNRNYVFDDAGDNEYGDVLSGSERAEWKSQWSGANQVYFNPQVDYQPWPLPVQDTATDGIDRMPNADTTNPISNPDFLIDGDATNDNVTLNMTDVYHTVPAAISGVIVDNQDGAPGFVRTGTWGESSLVPEWNGSSFYTNTSGDYATFTPTIPTAGSYDVHAWWNCFSSRDSNAMVTIVHNGATSPTTIFMNQQSTVNDTPESGVCGEWLPIGTYDFLAGTAGSVKIERHTGSTGGSTVADAIRFVTSGATVPTALDIYNAHYYTQAWVDADGDGNEDADELTNYLVNFNNGVRDVYRINDSNSNDIIDDTGELELIGNELPLSIRPAIYDADGNVTGYRDAANELQNFTNWFSYYRKRELAAKAAVANVIADSSGLYVGFYSLHDYNAGITRQPVLPVRIGGVGDDTRTLLTNLYTMDSDGGTPLRYALKNVGRYFDDTDSYSGNLGSSPYYSQADGGACQHAFAIVMTDGFWNGSSPSVGNVDNGEGAPYEDSYSSTLADVAMYYYNKDLSTLPNFIPTTDCDGSSHQHMVTFSVSFGLNGTIDINDINANNTPDAREDFNGDGNPDGLSYKNDPCFLDSNTPRPTWPSPQANLPSTIDDLWHAAVNGRGEFYSASEPGELVDSLMSIFATIGSISATGAAVAISGDILTSETLVYRTDYNSQTWAGNLLVYRFVPDTTDIDFENPSWQASDVLNPANDPHFWDTGRRIVTYNDNTSSGVPFRYASLSTNQQDILKLNADASLTAAEKTVWAESILNYVRGKTDLPGFRERLAADFSTNILGDIVHSQPVLVDDMIYVGGNDGMLHAFKITSSGTSVTGFESFAYVPSLVYGNLPLLKEPIYPHRFFVNATPIVQKGVGASDITLLVGGLGKGGKGYYALDVTNADTFDGSTGESSISSIVKWEYPSSGATDSDMGFSYSKPFVVQSNDSGRWVVIFGNGYNSTNEHAVLYVLDALTGALIKKLDTNIGSDNGLSTPALIDLNNDSRVDIVYAGDLKGNLWKFDLRNLSQSDWQGDSTNWSVAFSGSALFSAEGPTTNSNPQPITSKPAVMKHPIRHGQMVVFGTGKFLGDSDRIDTDTQTFYGIWDFSDADTSEYLGTFNRSTNGLGNLSGIKLLKQDTVYQDNFLTNQSIIQTFGTDGSDGDTSVHPLRITSDNTGNWAVNNDTPFPNPDPAAAEQAHAGWYYDLPITGERLIENPLIREGKFIGLTIIPDDGYCQGGGWTIVNEMDALDGSRLFKPSFDTTGKETSGKHTGKYLVNESDKINLTGLTGETEDGGGTKWVAATGILKPTGGILHLSEESIVELPGTVPTLEIKILSSSEGRLDQVIELAPKRGIAFWREH